MKRFISLVLVLFTVNIQAANPFDIMQSTNWKLTLPINSAQEIKIPVLQTYTSEWFYLNAAKDGAVFVARTDGATTSGSSNPRSELRELNGSSNASWSSTTGEHSMTVVFSTDVLPIGSKPVVVTGQIHDASDDISVFRVEGNTSGDRSIASIWITDGNTTHGHLLTANYHLGDKYTVEFIVRGGQILYMFNGQQVDFMESKVFTGGYFKAGSYNQSGGNCTKLADGQCDYAQVTIYSIQVCHDGNCSGQSTTQPTQQVTVQPTVSNTKTAIPTSTPTVVSSSTNTPISVAKPTNTPKVTATPTLIVTVPSSPLPTNTPTLISTVPPLPQPTATRKAKHHKPTSTPEVKPNNLPTTVPTMIMTAPPTLIPTAPATPQPQNFVYFPYISR